MRSLGGFLLTTAALAGATAMAAPVAANAPPEPVKRSKFIPDCEVGRVVDLCRAPVDFDAVQAAARLGDRPLAYWIEGQTLKIAARNATPALKLTGSIQDGMAPLAEDAKGRLWAAAYRLPHLDESLIEMRLRPDPNPDPAKGVMLTWRGSRAPAFEASPAVLQGSIETLAVASPALKGERKVSIYRPKAPPPSGGYGVVVTTDGVDLEQYAPIVDALIAQGRIRPLVMVGVWAAYDPAVTAPGGLRWREYGKGVDEAAYAAHAAFVLDELLPRLQRDEHLSDKAGDWMLFGFSNGADWSLAVATSHPDRFGSVAAFSPADGAVDFSKAKGLRVFLEAGRYETPFLIAAGKVRDAALAAGAPCTLDTYYVGHSSGVWRMQFAKTLVAVFGR